MHELWRVASAVHAGLRAEAFDAYPDEACGALSGAPRERRVTGLHPLPNVHDGSRRAHYRIDPLALASLEDALDAQGTALVGLFHSHPHRPATPSETDRAAAWPGLLHIIQEVRGPGAEGAIKAWRFDDALRPRIVSLRLEG